MCHAQSIFIIYPQHRPHISSSISLFLQSKISHKQSHSRPPFIHHPQHSTARLDTTRKDPRHKVNLSSPLNLSSRSSLPDGFEQP
mmetsp:Transcript_20504/g.58577  ORF Transcript_20504/g.58577 Transcript_20504/m.58577 type:complete len:85 (-) Transcript_20504:255-509(-)